jgi:hypothetical protein
LGFQPSDAPKSIRRSIASSLSGKSPKSAEPPKLPPKKGEKYQLCADAVAGANINESAPIIKSLRTCIAPPKGMSITAIRPFLVQAPCLTCLSAAMHPRIGPKRDNLMDGLLLALDSLGEGS